MTDIPLPSAHQDGLGNIDFPNSPAAAWKLARIPTGIPNAYLAPMAPATVKANTTGSSALPTDATLSALLDTAIGSTTGALLYRGASVWALLAPGASGTILTSNGAGLLPAFSAPVSPAIPRGFLSGFTLSNDATTPNSVIDVSAGQATSSDQTTFMTLSSAITKSIAATWAVGSGNGGLDTGAVLASTWYHVYLIQRTDTNVVDVLLSQAPNLSAAVTCTSASPGVLTWSGGALPFQNGAPIVLSGTTAPTGLTLGTTYYVVSANQSAGTFSLAATPGGAAINTTGTGTGLTATSAPVLPASYTKLRRIGSIKTNTSSQILAFSQNGDEFLWATAVTDINSVAQTTTALLPTLTVPIGVKVMARSRYVWNTSGTASVLIQSPDEAPQAAGAPNVTFVTFNASYAGGSLDVRTNLSQQVRTNGASGNLSAVTYGWIDTRGRLS